MIPQKRIRTCVQMPTTGLFLLLLLSSVGMAWFNSSLHYRFPVDCTNMSSGEQILVNGSAGFAFNGTQQFVYVKCEPSLYVYYNNDTDWSVANDTANVPREVKSGNVSSLNPSSVWLGRNISGDWLMNETNGTLIDRAGNNNLTNNTAGQVARRNNSYMGGGIDVGLVPNVVFYKATTTGIPIGANESTVLIWYRFNDNASDNYNMIFSWGAEVSGQARGMALSNGTPSSMFLYGSAFGTDFASSLATKLGREDFAAFVSINATGVRLFNGTTFQSGTVGGGNTQATNLKLGGSPAASSFSYVTNATVYEVRVYSRNLTDAEISSILNNTKGITGFGSAGASETFGVTYTLAYTTPEYDLIQYKHDLVVDTNSTGYDINATFIFDGVSYSPAKTAGTQQFNFTYTLFPTPVSTQSTKTATWVVNGAYPNGTAFQTNQTYGVVIVPSGLVACNATANVSSAQFIAYDELTNAQLNITTVSAITEGAKTASITNTSINSTLCINPSNLTTSASIQLFANLTGYAPKTLSFPAQSYGSTLTVHNFTMVNLSSSGAQSVVFMVQTQSYSPLPGYTIKIDRFIAANNTFINSGYLVTDTSGQASQVLLIQNPYYNVTVYNPSNVQVFNAPSVIFCQTGTLPCTYTVSIGSTAPNYYNGTGQNYYQNYSSYAMGADQFNGGGACSFNNNTKILSCYFSDNVSYNVTLNLYNVTNNKKAFIATSTSLSNVSVTVPNVKGIYAFEFIAYYSDKSTQYGLNFTKLIEAGTVIIQVGQSNQYGRDGWFFTLIIVLTLALVLSFNPSAMVLGAGGGVIASAIIGFITLNPITLAGIAILTFIIATWVNG